LPKIYELDPHVADLIAAGEVVERPASVVKELAENSIDAGATIITVEISAGGMTYIRVTDNGCGIAPGDAKTAFLRHATSKLRGAEGLEAIGTLGFRGEALAAIAAVSRIELLTRETFAVEGAGLSLEAGVVRGESPAGCPEGTTIIVRDLFFNTPARLKFMKSDRAESSGVATAVIRCALSHPEVSIRFIRDGKTEYHTPGDSRADSCIYSLFGRDFAAGLIEANSSFESVAVTGFVSSQAAARGNRSYQFFFVNGRTIRSATLQAALERAYENTLPSGRFPSCILYISTGFGNVDVNVHPAKTEVKFVSDKQVFDGVYYAALGALEGTRTNQNPEIGMRNADLGNAELRNAEPSKQNNSEFRISNSELPKTGFKSMQVDEYKRQYNSVNPKQGAYKKEDASNVQQPSAGGITAQPNNNSEFRIPNSGFDSSSMRVIGEAFKTYIIAESGDSVWLIDKHAAHERIHFNALKSGSSEPMSQALITPVICRNGSEDTSLLLDNTDLLEKLGFSVERFGEDAVAVRGIPADIELGEAESALTDICAELSRGGAAEPARLDGIYRAMACKAAIKAGKTTTMRELESLATRVLSGEISHCPHGRPLAMQLTRTTLAKYFKRI